MNYTVRRSLKIVLFLSLLFLVFSQYFFFSSVFSTFKNPEYVKGSFHIFMRTHASLPKQGDFVYFYDKSLPRIGFVVALPGDAVTLYKREIYVNYVNIKTGEILPSGVVTSKKKSHTGGLLPGDYLILPTDDKFLVTDINDYIVEKENIKGRAIIKVF